MGIDKLSVSTKSNQNDTPPNWTAELRTRLRADLDECVRDDQIESMIKLFIEKETHRLRGPGFEVDAPGDTQYKRTVAELNRICEKFTRWRRSGQSKLDEELATLIDDYNEELDIVMDDHATNSLFIEYDEDRGNSFYALALLTWLNDFKAGKSRSQKKLSGKVNYNGLTVTQHATVYCILYPGKAGVKGEEQERQLEYVRQNTLDFEDKQFQNFSRYIRKRRNEQNLNSRELANRLSELEIIRPYLTERYPESIALLEKEKNYYNKELADLE